MVLVEFRLSAAARRCTSMIASASSLWWLSARGIATQERRASDANSHLFHQEQELSSDGTSKSLFEIDTATSNDPRPEELAEDVTDTTDEAAAFESDEKEPFDDSDSSLFVQISDKSAARTQSKLQPAGEEPGNTGFTAKDVRGGLDAVGNAFMGALKSPEAQGVKDAATDGVKNFNWTDAALNLKNGATTLKNAVDSPGGQAAVEALGTGVRTAADLTVKAGREGVKTWNSPEVKTLGKMVGQAEGAIEGKLADQQENRTKDEQNRTKDEQNRTKDEDEGSFCHSGATTAGLSRGLMPVVFFAVGGFLSAGWWFRLPAYGSLWRSF